MPARRPLHRGQARRGRRGDTADAALGGPAIADIGTRRLASLRAITAALSAVRTPAEAARVVLSRGLAALGADAGAVRLLSDDGADLVRIGIEGYPADMLAAAAERLPMGSPSPMCVTVRSGRPVFLADEAAYARRFPAFAGLASVSGYRAAAALPLIVDGRALGALALSYAAPQRFDRPGRAYAATLADLTAQALDRARLHEAEQARAAATAAQAEVGAILAGTLEPTQLYERLLTHFSRILPYDHAAVLLHEDGWAVVAGSRGRLTVPVGLRALRVADLPPTLASGDDGRPLLVRDTGTLDWIRVPPFVGARSIRSVLVVPLVVDGRVVGTFNADSFTPGFYTERHLADAIALGGHVTRALHNARLYTAERERAAAAEELARLHAEQAAEAAVFEEVGAALNASLDPRTLYSLILAQVTRLLPCDHATVAMYGAGRLTFEATWGSPCVAPGTSFPCGAMWVPGDQRSVAYEPDVLEIPGWLAVPPLTGEFHDRSLISAPLRIDGLTVGSFDVSSRTPHFYSPRHLRLVARFAEHVTLALRNARLYAAERERARAAEELVRLRSDFVASVSHELRTPLTAMVGFGELLESRWEAIGDTQRRATVGKIVASARRQQRLVGDLLLLSRLEGGPPAVRPSAEPVGPLLERAVEEVRAGYAGQRVELAGPPGLLALVDGERLVQVAANLIDNAAKYSPEGSAIAVDWRAEGRWAAIRMRDQGPGIPETHRGVLFTRFGRVPGSRSRAGHVGTGLGLYLCRRLAGAMGGEVDLESTGSGGSVFRLRVPLAGDYASPTAPAARAGP